MSRNLMPRSGAMAPYIVVNRDAAVAGVFSIDGEAGSIVLSTKYLQIANYNTDKAEIEEAIGANTSAIGSHTAAIQNLTSQMGSKVNATDVYAKTETYTKTEVDTALEDAKTQADTDYLSKAGNLQGLVDKAAAWLNVRPIGATPLAADPVGDYDAATKRWVQNLLSSGTAGPTMNGVMNLGVGAPVMWETRAYIPPYCLPRDGQLVNRADWPELWAWAQKTTPITDAAWLADVTKRGSYSTGDGSTTFRLPDWNGVQSGSIPGVFFRGGNGTADMTMSLSAAPNITGSTGLVLTSQTTTSWGSLTDNWSKYWSTAAPGGNISNVYRENSVGIDASKSSLVYGRNNTNEVVPNKVSGVWLVRASGSFEAANTSWSVTNADTTMPGNGTVVRGGAVRSAYQAAGAEKAAAELQAVLTTGATGAKTVTAEVIVKDSTGGSAVSKTIKLGTVDGLTGGTITSRVLIAGTITSIPGTIVNPGPLFQSEIKDQFNTTINSNIYTELNAGKYSQTTISNFDSGRPVSSQNQYWSFRSDGSAYANGSWVNGASDIRVKKDFQEIKDPLTTMRKIKAGTWRMNTERGNDRFGIGVLANGLYDDYPEAKLVNGDQTLADGTVVKDVLTVQAGDSGVLAAVHHATLLKLMDKIEALEAEIKELKAK
ncbi:tail fiber protein [Yersinia phage phiR2-01]|uniref:Phage tail fiber protein n=1 Tax=Yersinia phage phiR2-01 TaxID=1206557 RepID=I7K2R4_9CAUD|nr:tail fiber protein [Yersinia phage phiR2-01]CCI88551.1 phage tail fiber protein [Yersinia phage phiR2-01]